MKARIYLVTGIFSALLIVLVGSPRAAAAEDDYDFPSRRHLSEIGDDDASSRLAEGFEGLDAEPSISLMTEPADGAGGFDNVAPRLGAEEGPGGLDWDPSPSYRTRYKGGTDYAAGSGTRLQGNNWFTPMPYATYDSTTDQWRVRFDANTFRVYTRPDTNYQIWYGQYENKNSKLVRTNQGQISEEVKINDTRGKVYTLPGYTNNYKCTKIEGLGGAQITISYSSNITVLQKPSATSNNEVRRFTYTIASNRIDKIDIEEKVSGTWTLYRKIDFTYHENISGAVEGSSGDLVGIQEDTLLSDGSSWLTRKWVFKYYVGAYNDQTPPPPLNLGYPYQVKAILGPQSVHDWEMANSGLPTTDIYKKTASDLAAYADRTYKYHSDRRISELELKSSCGCGGGEGVYSYINSSGLIGWDINNGTISDLNTWAHRVTVRLPTVNGSSRIVDYNKHGQVINYIAQEDATDNGSPRWIQAFAHDTTGRITDSYSVKACTGYTDASHSVTTTNADGMRYQYDYDSNSALASIKLRNPANGDWNFQRTKVFSLRTSGDRRRFVKTTDKVYRSQTTADTGGDVTAWDYTYHTGTDALAIKSRRAVLPVVATGENGSGSAVKPLDYFEADGRLSWSRDGDSYVQYRAYDTNRWLITQTIVDANTSTLTPPSADTSLPGGDPGFATPSGGGLHIVTDYYYDFLRRPTKITLPAFYAWDGSGVTSLSTTKQWYYTKLSGGEAVTVAYDHLDGSYFHHALKLSVKDYEGHTVTSALGRLATQNTSLSDDIDATDSTLGAAFNGTLVRRTDYTYEGGKLIKEEIYSEATSGSDKYTTEHTYDASGRKLTTKSPAGTITHWGYDVLGRIISEKIGTIDGGGSDNMTLVEERFYDGEVPGTPAVGDGTLTRVNRYTANGGAARQANYMYDYRARLTQADSPHNVQEKRTYTNRNQVDLLQRFDSSTGPATLLAQTQYFYDSWGQEHRSWEYHVPLHNGDGDSDWDHSSVDMWRNGRGQLIKQLTQGKVINKTAYDGAGRVTKRSMSYDASETAYSGAFDLSGDTVIEETRYVLDKTGALELVQLFQRNHNGSGTGQLDGSSGNARAQYTATWYDKLHRPTHAANYGTNGGSDLTARPSGNPPSSSASDKLVTKYGYYLEGESYQGTTLTLETLETIDPAGKIELRQLDDPGHTVKRIENWVNWTPGTDDDRTTEYTFNNVGQLETVTAKAAANDQLTKCEYGVVRGTANSLVSSNDLVYKIKYPDPDSGTPGQPSSDANDQVTFAYDAQQERIWKKDPQGTEHFYDYDDRGRLEHDRVPTVGTGIDATICRISRTYDKLDRPVLISSYHDAAVGGTPLNEVQFEYSYFNTVTTIYQEWAGAVSTGSSKKIQFAYSYPTNGSTGLRRTSTTHPDGSTVITNVYNSGIDDTISRVSGRKNGSTWLFQEAYLGRDRLVERQYGSTGLKWTLVGTDTPNQDGYVGLDRFGRIDDLAVKTGSWGSNEYLYTYNYNSQVTIREDLVGNVASSYEFSETFGYDGLGRLTDHRRGRLSSGTISGSNIRLHECWTLDRSGNPTAYYSGTSDSCSTPTVTAGFNASNEYTNRNGDYTYATYNDTGDLTKKGTYDIVYDAWNRVERVKNNGSKISTYKYNGLGQLIKREEASSQNDTYYYYNDAWQVVEEREVIAGTLLNWYVWGTQYIDDLVVRGPTTQYSVLDVNFNVVTRLDSSVAVVARHVYDAYGTPKQLSANWTTWQSISTDLYLFTGRQWRTDPGNYDFRNRVQDPGLSCFIQRDPIGIWGDQGNWGNGYGFVGQDPINSLDPSGEQEIFIMPEAFKPMIEGIAPEPIMPRPWLMAPNFARDQPGRAAAPPPAPPPPPPPPPPPQAKFKLAPRRVPPVAPPGNPGNGGDGEGDNRSDCSKPLEDFLIGWYKEVCEQPRRCDHERQDCPEMRRRLLLNLQCASRRQIVQTLCYSRSAGPEAQGYDQAVQDAIGGVGRCMTQLAIRGCHISG